jgi:hypothetical protein
MCILLSTFSRKLPPPCAAAAITAAATTAAAAAAAAGCVQALLTAGASIDLPMCNPSCQHSELPVVNGSTALHLAAGYGHTAIAALLMYAHVSILPWLGA